MDAWELLDTLEEARALVPHGAEDPRARTVRYHLDRACAAVRLSLLELTEDAERRRAEAGRAEQESRR